MSSAVNRSGRWLRERERERERESETERSARCTIRYHNVCVCISVCVSVCGVCVKMHNEQRNFHRIVHCTSTRQARLDLLEEREREKEREGARESEGVCKARAVLSAITYGSPLRRETWWSRNCCCMRTTQHINALSLSHSLSLSLSLSSTHTRTHTGGRGGGRRRRRRR